MRSIGRIVILCSFTLRSSLALFVSGVETPTFLQLMFADDTIAKNYALQS
jgi:hypothetical protein